MRVDSPVKGDEPQYFYARQRNVVKPITALAPTAGKATTMDPHNLNENRIRLAQLPPSEMLGKRIHEQMGPHLPVSKGAAHPLRKFM